LDARRPQLHPLDPVVQAREQIVRTVCGPDDRARVLERRLDPAAVAHGRLDPGTPRLVGLDPDRNAHATRSSASPRTSGSIPNPAASGGATIPSAIPSRCGKKRASSESSSTRTYSTISELGDAAARCTWRSGIPCGASGRSWAWASAATFMYSVTPPTNCTSGLRIDAAPLTIRSRKP